MDHTLPSDLVESLPGREAARSPARRFKVEPAEPSRFTTRRIGPLRHNFHEHPLVQLPALARLARELAATNQCRFIEPGTTSQASEFNTRPAHPDGREIDEVFRRIEEPGSWVALYNVEKHPTYKAFLEEVIESVRPLAEREQGAIFKVTGFIFISAPPSVTPFHIDRENNFWLQLKGRKIISVWDHTDRVVVPGADVDFFMLYGSLSNVKLKEGFAARSHEFDVGPGDGVYFPSTSPHATRSDRDWVKPGDGVSISMGVDFYTDETRRNAYVHACNLLLRKLGVSPREPGRSAAIDRIKYPLGRLFIWAKATFRGFESKDGF